MRLYTALTLTAMLIVPQIAAADTTTTTTTITPVADPVPVNVIPVTAVPATMQPTGCATCGHAVGALKPGCCEHRNHSNDNAWDGYCQEKACCDAIWARVGTGTLLTGIHPGYTGKTCGCQDGGFQFGGCKACEAIAKRVKHECTACAEKEVPEAPLAPNCQP